jgi:hypothetical protein
MIINQFEVSIDTAGIRNLGRRRCINRYLVKLMMT